MKGFRDFYPSDQRKQNYIFKIWKSVALKYGFEEFSAPVLEPIELFNKSGQEIPEQMYTLKDKSDRQLALRPELTPSLARMINESPNLPKPIKWFSIPECFRYENIQTGRSRSFFQFNLDIIGTTSMKADAEVIVTTIKIMESFGLTQKDFYIRISNRKFMDDFLKELGIKDSKPIFRIVDKINKISISEFQKELKQLFKYLKDFDVSKYCQLDLTISRGFDYYTSTIFEVFDKSLKFRALAGGGRYDNLANLPGVGYGMGDIVLQVLLEDKKKLPKIENDLDYYIVLVNEEMFSTGVKIAEKLRENNRVELDLTERNLGKQLNYANSKNAKKVIIVGPEELKKNKVRIRDMKTGK